MGLGYDFDIVAIAPGENDMDGGAGQARAAVVPRALFRDIKTADALRAASPNIRRMFLDAGFGLEPHESALPAGYYSFRDTEDRVRILHRLFSNIKAMGIQGEYCGEFDLRQFLHSVKTARPINAKDRPPPLRLSQSAKTEPVKQDRRTVPGRIGFALGLAVLVFALLKYLAAAGASP